eukprot:1671158-Pyramimonas_sp.AAC.1
MMRSRVAGPMFKMGTRHRRQHHLAFQSRSHQAMARRSMGGSSACSGTPTPSFGFHMKHPRG